MHQTRSPHRWVAIAIAASFALVVGPAAADNKSPAEEETRTHLAGPQVTQIEEQEDGLDLEWFRQNIRLKKKRGFEYSRSFTVRKDKKLVFSVQGPLLRKKTPGLAFEIRF